MRAPAVLASVVASVSALSACGSDPTFVYFQDDTTTGCSKPTATSVRLRTSGNTQTAKPCSLD